LAGEAPDSSGVESGRLNPDPTLLARLRAELTTIADDVALAGACREWLTRPCIALDSEFERSHTYYPEAALIQLYDGHRAWLVDAPCIDDWTPFCALLRAPAVLKIVHAGGEDLELFQYLGATAPTPFFDTQIAAAFCGHGTQRGYATLVDDLLGHRPEKSQTRSNWLARPLSEAQIRYAIEDIAWLPALHEALSARLAERRHAAWAALETARLVTQRASPEDTEHSYLRVRGADRLAATELAVLAALAAWRESAARRCNRPRRWIIDDQGLLALARARPRNTTELAAVAINRRVATRNAAALLDAVAHGLQRGAPSAPHSTLHSKTLAVTIKRLKTVARARALALDLPDELLAPSRLVEVVAERSIRRGAAAVAEVLDTWRDQAVGDALREELGRGVDGDAN